MNLATQAILHTCLQDAYSLFWCKEATVAEHIDIVGQSLSSHCRQHLVDNHIYIVTLTMASRYGMGTKKGADDRNRRRLLDASDDAQHLQLVSGIETIAALDFHGTSTLADDFIDALHRGMVQVIFRHVVQTVGTVQNATTPTSYLLVG